MADTLSSSLPGLGDLEALVLCVFARVWEEFNIADTEFCETTIGSLAAPPVAEDNTLATKSKNTAVLPGDMKPCVPSAVTPTSCPSEPRVPCVCDETDIQTFPLSPAVEPYPEYEGWTPTNRSIFRGDDSDPMQFLPFADEPAFDQHAYSDFFKAFAWQGSEQMDADCELLLVWPSFR